jgi:hypothetical protein
MKTGGPVEIEAQLASTSRSRRSKSSMAAQLTDGNEGARRGLALAVGHVVGEVEVRERRDLELGD